MELISIIMNPLCDIFWMFTIVIISLKINIQSITSMMFSEGSINHFSWMTRNMKKRRTKHTITFSVNFCWFTWIWGLLYIAGLCKASKTKSAVYIFFLTNFCLSLSLLISEMKEVCLNVTYPQRILFCLHDDIEINVIGSYDSKDPGFFFTWALYLFTWGRWLSLPVW